MGASVRLRRRFDIIRFNFVSQTILVAFRKNVEVVEIPRQL